MVIIMMKMMDINNMAILMCLRSFFSIWWLLIMLVYSWSLSGTKSKTMFNLVYLTIKMTLGWICFLSFPWILFLTCVCLPLRSLDSIWWLLVTLVSPWSLSGHQIGFNSLALAWHLITSLYIATCNMRMIKLSPRDQWLSEIAIHWWINECIQFNIW